MRPFRNRRRCCRRSAWRRCEALRCASFFALRYGYARLRGRQGLGLGDVKLAFVAGAWLDWLMHSDCDPIGGICSDVDLCAATAYIRAIDFGDHAHALWSVFRAGDLDLLGDRGEVAVAF